MNPIEQNLNKTVELKKTGQVTAAAGGPMPAGMQRDDQAQQPLKNAHPSIVAYHEPDSFVAEQYRKLKTVVLRMTRENFRNMLMVTSALSGEGKSITCANLAVMLARDYGQTVLLIDADLRRPSLHQYLGIDAAPGLTDCLEDNVEAGRAIVKTGIAKLSFLPAGKKAADPGELLSSQKLTEFLKEIKHRYRDRYIILDTSPALLFAETHAISAHIDGILSVVKERVSTAGDVKQMLDLLNASKVLGIIYNDARSGHVDARYHHYYRNQYAGTRKPSGKRGKND